MKKSIHYISLILICTLLLCTGTASATGSYSGGDGSIEHPYNLSSASDIVTLSNTPDDWGKNFTLTNDIILEANHTPIGIDTNSPFTGNFNGNGYTISNLTVYATTSFAGFFGITGSGANIHDLGIEISSEGVYSTSGYVGGLVGVVYLDGIVSNCSVTGNVNGTSDVGGLVGSIYSGSGTVTNSYFTGTVTSSYEGLSSHAGGLVGSNSGTVSNSYATGTVTSSCVGSGGYVGGLAGSNIGTVSNSYFTGTVTSSFGGIRVNNSYDGWSYVGGLVGFNYEGGTVSNSYTTGTVTGSVYNDARPYFGGLVGSNEGDINDYCYYSGSPNNGIGQTTNADNFKSFSFVSGSSGLNWNASGNIITTEDDSSFIWKIDDGSSLPYLQWQIPEVTGPYSGGSGTVDDPYLLLTDADIDELSNTSADWGMNFTLMNDIVLEGKHTPIGNITIPFTGNFSGDGHVISNLTIYQESNYAGFFGYTNTSANIYNLGIETSSEGVYSTYNYVGGLVGYNEGEMNNCSVTGNVTGGGNIIGGLVGFNSGTVSNSYATVNVTGTGSLTGHSDATGGLVGFNSGTVSNSYTTGTVTSNNNIGGLVAENGGTVSNSYSTCTVKGSSGVGGLVAWNSGTVTKSYYSGSPNNGIGIFSSFINFTNFTFISGNSGLNWNESGSVITTSDDSNYIWKIIDGYTLPYFQWQDTPVPVPYVETISKSSAINNTDLSTEFWINLTGCSFYNITDSVFVNLTMDGQTPISGEIDGASLTYNTINAKFDLTKAIVGDWLLYVINPDGQTSIAKSFRVDTLSTPQSLINKTGNFWVNHSWNADTSGTTDSYNISINGTTWKNGTQENYFNHTENDGLSAHAWSNITVYAYNATYSILSEGVSENVQIPNNNVTILDIDNITVTETETIVFDINSSDADGDIDSPVFGCNNTTPFNSFDINTGKGSWSTDLSDAGNYSVKFNVSDGHGSVDSKVITITVNDFSIATPDLSNSTGNFYVNWTWDSVEKADFYNVSYNGTWDNVTTNYYNHTDLPAHGWSNVTVFAYNATYSVLSEGVNDNVSLPNNDVVILNVTDIASIEGANIIFDINYTDADDDKVLFDCNQTSLFDEFNTSTGEGSWKPNFGENGTYYVEFNVSDDYGPVASEVMKITVEPMPSPENLANSTGNFWVNHSWTIGSGAVIDSYNVSYNDTYWANGTKNTYYNHTGLYDHDWSNVTVYAYNATHSVLSLGVTENVQIPNNNVTILDVTNITVAEGESVVLDINSTDEDTGDAPTFGCNRTDLFTNFNNSNGKGSWNTDYFDAGIYYVEFNVSDNHGSADSEVMKITVTSTPITMHVGSGADHDFSSIQAAINVASEGDTIIVTDGTYNENVDVNKSVILRSENGSYHTNVTAKYPYDYVFDITENNVTIDGFNISGATDSIDFDGIDTSFKQRYAAGIYLSRNINCTISNNTLIGNYYGIYLDYLSNNNTLMNNNASKNNGGIMLFVSNNNTLRNNIANDNDQVGIMLAETTDNVLRNNIVMNNPLYDINVLGSNDEINDLKITEKDALISFLSDRTPIVIKGNATNSTTLSGKVNVNGYFTIDRSAIRDSSVDINTELPVILMPINITVSYDDSGMSSPVESSIDLYKYNGTANESTWVAVSNTSLNTSSNQVTVAITEGTFGLFRNPEPTHSDGGVRVSLGQGQDPAKVLNSFTSMLRITGGSEVNYDFSGSDTPVLGISFDAKQDKGLVVSKVQVLSSAPEGVPAPSGKPYQVMSIDVGSEGTISSDSADNVLIHFKVSKQWIEENNIDISTIRMSRYHDEEWNDLPTTQENEDAEYFYFYAETPGFSVFEIVGDEIGETPEQVPVASPTTEEDKEPEEDAENSIPGFTAFAGIVLVSLAVLLRRK